MTVIKGEITGENYITQRLVKMNIKDIVVDYDYFSRVALDEDTIARYQEQYELGETLPPLVVQKVKHILIDGFHRHEAQKRLGWEETEVEFRDIPEDEIYLTSIELNLRHGLPFSIEDRNEQIRRMRFEFDPPLTYEEIGKRVGLSTSRVGEICREEFKINDTINTKVDARSKITPEETEEIQDRLEAGEPTSKIAEDYPVSESRVSQLKKDPRKLKSYEMTKQKTLSQMPKSWIRRRLVKRFKANNPLADSQEIDFDAYLLVNDYEFYHDLIGEYEQAYPQYEWRYPKEKEMFGLNEHGYPFEMVYDKSIEIRLKLYWTGGGKYAQVKWTIPKKDLEYLRNRLYDEFTIEWPLVEVERPDERQVFSNEDLAEMEERSMAQFREPEFWESEEDEEIRKWGDMILDE